MNRFAAATPSPGAIAAALLFVLCRADRQRLVLFSACAYLLSALLVVPYGLTFQGVVDDHGYVGNEHSAAFFGSSDTHSLLLLLVSAAE